MVNKAINSMLRQCTCPPGCYHTIRLGKTVKMKADKADEICSTLLVLAPKAHLHRNGRGFILFRGPEGARMYDRVVNLIERHGPDEVKMSLRAMGTKAEKRGYIKELLASPLKKGDKLVFSSKRQELVLLTS